jgi:hypothetical protein
MKNISIVPDGETAIVEFYDYELEVIFEAYKARGQIYCKEIFPGSNICGVTSISNLQRVLDAFKSNDKYIQQILKCLQVQLSAVIEIIKVSRISLTFRDNAVKDNVESRDRNENTRKNEVLNCGPDTISKRCTETLKKRR